MTQSDLFALLGAPLANSRWSWGSVRSDGAVFLRVWQDQIREHAGKRYVRITNAQAADQYKGQTGRYKPGYQERIRHVALIQQGASTFLIMCEAVDLAAMPRQVKDFNEEEVFPGGAIVELDGDWWIELRPRVPVREVTPKPKGNMSAQGATVEPPGE